MVFKLHERTFESNELGQLAYESQNQLEDGGVSYHLSSLIPEKLSTLVGRKEFFDCSHLDNVTAGALNVSSRGAPGCSINKSPDVEKLNGVIVLEHHKRPLADDKDLFTKKRLKQLEPYLPLDSHLHCGNLPAPTSGEKDSHVDAPFLTNSFPSYSGVNLRTSDMHQSREIYSSFLDYYPRKLVAIGPNHQAIIPECRFNDLKKHFGDNGDCDSALTPVKCSSLSENIMVGEDDSGKMIGTCVMPMPSAATLFSHIVILHNNTDCSCSDVGSARCVRQHITEVRINLHKALGHHTFVELGLYNMGESVAEKWTEREEHLFQEVVLANPASLNKNFWDVLPHVLPSRGSKELVSYYFNVFMLRKRAGQNRLDPMNVDSDDDEWKESDDGECAIVSDNDGWKERSDEYATEEEDEDEDSAVESPEEQGATYAEAYDEEVDVDEESDGSEEYAVVKDDEGRISAFSNTRTGNSSQDYVEEVADDSCTSFEAHYNRGNLSIGPLENVETLPLFFGEHENLLKNDDLGATADHGIFEGLFGLKTWDMSYSHGWKKDDFFSTCNVIEEVFGDEPTKEQC